MKILALNLILPLRGFVPVRRSEGDGAVFVAVHVTALLGFDANPGRIPKFQKESVRCVRVSRQSVIMEMQKLAVLT